VPKKTHKYFGRVKEIMAASGTGRKRNHPRGLRRKCLGLKKVKELSCAPLLRIFHRFLSCVGGDDIQNGDFDQC
jgi:hypothetical protein